MYVSHCVAFLSLVLFACEDQIQEQDPGESFPDSTVFTSPGDPDAETSNIIANSENDRCDEEM